MMTGIETFLLKRTLIVRHGKDASTDPKSKNKSANKQIPNHEAHTYTTQSELGLLQERLATQITSITAPARQGGWLL